MKNVVALKINAERSRKKMRRHSVTGLKYLFLVLLALFFIFPFFSMVSKSLMTNDEINFGMKILPKTLYFGAYSQALDGKMVYWLFNTLIIAGINVIGIPLAASLCAYGFAKMRFPGRDALFAVALGTLMLPSIAMQIPLYAIYEKIQWLGTWYPLIIPGLFGGGVINIFLIRQYMRGIPDQLTDAAKIDGANSFLVFSKIIVPLCMPIITYTMVNTFLGVWNDFMGPLLYLGNKESIYTLSRGMYQRFRLTSGSLDFANTQMAAGFVMMLPCLTLFFLFQKQLINGVTLTGMKS